MIYVLRVPGVEKTRERKRAMETYAAELALSCERLLFFRN
jgi:hypothetical protein